MIPGKYFLHDSVRGSMGASIGLVRNTPKKNPRGTGHTSDRLGCLATFCFGRQRMKNFGSRFQNTLHRFVKRLLFNNHRSAGPMARRLTTNQEIAGSIPASINNVIHHLGDNIFYFFGIQLLHELHGWLPATLSTCQNSRAVET